MLKKIGLLTIMSLIFILMGCSSVTVKHDYDPSVDFSKYKTYKWGIANDPNDALLKNQLILDRVYYAIYLSLEKKGFKKIESDPDFIVYPHGTTKEKTDIQNWGYGYGGWWGAGPYGAWGGGNIDVTQYTEGTLIIDIVDIKKNQLIWRGVGKGIVGDPSTPEKSTENINKVVKQILEDFPPDLQKGK